MPCDTIEDILHRETGRFSGEIYDRIFPTSPWIGLVKRGEFPLGMGGTISQLIYERTAPTDAAPAWSAFTAAEIADGTDQGTCNPTATAIGIGSSTRSFSLKRRVLEGPDICMTDIQFSFQLRDQLEKVMNVISEYTRYEWEIRYRHDYLAALPTANCTICTSDAGLIPMGTIAEAAGGLTIDDGALSAVTAVSILTQGMLNRVKVKLFRDGATLSALGKDNGMGALTLICSAETSDRIIYENDDSRNDLRYAKPSELLAQYGVDRTYKGFFHLIDPFPMRFTFATGIFTEVPAFASTAADKGNKTIINTAWEAAGYEISFLFDREVFHSLIPKPNANPHSKIAFDPQSFLGDWKLKNIISRDCNPDGTIVFHRGHLGHAPKRVHPERGWAFLHKRCDAPLDAVVTCPA